MVGHPKIGLRIENCEIKNAKLDDLQRSSKC